MGKIKWPQKGELCWLNMVICALYHLVKACILYKKGQRIFSWVRNYSGVNWFFVSNEILWQLRIVIAELNKVARHAEPPLLLRKPGSPTTDNNHCNRERGSRLATKLQSQHPFFAKNITGKFFFWFKKMSYKNIQSAGTSLQIIGFYPHRRKSMYYNII